MSRRRVVLTGLGTVNPVAYDVPGYWKAILAGQAGIGPITLLDSTAFKVHNAGEVRNFQPETVINPKEVRRMDRYAQFGMYAALEAVRDSGLDFTKEDPFRCGVIIGSGIGGLSELEEQYAIYLERGPSRIGPFVVPKMIANAASGHVSIHYGLMGPNTAVATACASAAHAVGDAMRAIQYDHADVMISGGAEAAITHMGLGGFVSARALSLRVNDDPNGASRPFDKDRDGFVLSEGAGIVMLEELERAKKRGAKIYAELLGVGSTADAYHITAPHPEGTGASRAMENALRDAQLAPPDIDYINAHGTSTELGDAVETVAIKRVFGEHSRKLAVSSTKSMLGHTLGESGGIELIATALSIRHRVVHPTINYQTPDPACDLDYVPNTAREMRVRNAISNSFGFGGHNCTLVIGALR